MKIAIYSRKSKFTGKGDSIGNQIELCKDYAERYFDDIEDYYIYEDEGFSGGDTNRPKFQELMRDAQNKKFDVLICYRLDRVSRNVADFSVTIEELNSLGVGFVSIKEQFDTSTPMGRAMMYIASVFAQLERETISERIKDNMMQLATTGRWMGGPAPYGFETMRITYEDSSEEERSYTKLVPVTEELEMIEFIYDKYLEFQSIHQVRLYLINNNYRTKNDKIFSSSVLLDILRNPIFVKTNQEVVDYLISSDINVAGLERLDGSKAISIYNKQAKDGTPRVKSDWVASVTMHDGVLSPSKWLHVQRVLDENQNTIPRTGTSKVALLGGLIKCKSCGAAMNIVYGVKRKDGTAPHYYSCRNKIISNGKLCQSKNVNGTDADLTVIRKIVELSKSDSSFKKHTQALEIKNNSQNSRNSIISLKSKASDLLNEINNLVEELSKSESISKYILPEIEKKDKELNKIEQEIKLLENKQDSNSINFDLALDNIRDFARKIELLDNEQKKHYVKTIVDEVIWDGSNHSLKVTIFSDKSVPSRYSSGTRWTKSDSGMVLNLKLDPGIKYIPTSANSYGARLRRTRRIKGYSGAELAELVGYSRQMIHKIERDELKPNKAALKKILEVLDISHDYLKHGKKGQ